MDASQAPEKESNVCPAIPITNCPANAQFEKVLNDLAYIRRAFPENEFGEPDILGHRRAHDAQIEAKEAEKAFWVGFKNELIRRGTYFLIVALAGILATGLIVKFRGLVLQIVEHK